MDKIYNGAVDSVASRINAETRSLLVRIKVINDNLDKIYCGWWSEILILNEWKKICLGIEMPQ